MLVQHIHGPPWDEAHRVGRRVLSELTSWHKTIEACVFFSIGRQRWSQDHWTELGAFRALPLSG